MNTKQAKNLKPIPEKKMSEWAIRNRFEFVEKGAELYAKT
jgi:hypothetical protein